MRLDPKPEWTPALWTDPGDVDTTDGDLCIAIAELAFASQPTPIVLDEWQKWVIRLALARDSEGKRLYRQFLVSVGRQNGKSTLATALVLYGMLTRADANVVGIASNADQANIVYGGTLRTILNSPSLKKRFKRTTETRSLVTHAGARYKVLPSKESALQGHSMSLVIADEIHLMKQGVFNAVVIGAGQVQDSLLFGITTAGDEESTLLLDLYAKLNVGSPGLGGVIWEADEDARVDDLEQLKKANPALAEGRMDPEQVLAEVAIIEESKARRYRLNRFIAAENSWLTPGKWARLPQIDTSPVNPVIVVDRTPEWSAATISLAWKIGDQINTDLVYSIVKPDLQSLTDLTIKTLQAVPGTAYMDALALGDLHEALRIRGYRAEKLTKRDAFNAPAVAFQKITEGKVAHAHHPLVEWQLARTITKNVGDSYRLIRANQTVEIDAAHATVTSIYLAEIQQEIPMQIF